MKPFLRHRGRLATLNRANVDTDQIIPKQFLKSIRRTGFGEALFFDWRYLPDGQPDPAFELNAPRHHGATVLVTRTNFGCGSSREHAVWAVVQYGFRAVLAPFRMDGEVRVPAFADIFRNNSAKNGLLLIELSEEQIEDIFQAAERADGLDITVDLESQTLTLHELPERVIPFQVDPAVRDRLLRGLDDIAETLEHEADIQRFEQQHDVQMSVR